MEERLRNEYTVCFAYDSHKERSYEDFLASLNSAASDETDILFVRSCHKKEGDQGDNRYIIAVKKDFNDRYNSDEKFKTNTGITIMRYVINKSNQALKNNTTYGYFIPTDKILPENIIEFFLFFENAGFLRKNSYEIVYPNPYPDGNERKYLIVTFNKINNSYPKNFIKKFKTLINNTKFGDDFLKIKWVSNSVLKHIKNGEKKEIKIATSREVF